MELNNDRLLEYIQKAKLGQQTSFRVLLDYFWSDVYHFQLKRVQNENEAEDITIRTFSRAFDKIDTYNNDYEFKTWLITISKNIHIDLLRKSKTTLPLDNRKLEDKKVMQVIDDAPSPEDRIITEQNLAQLLLLIKQLKPKYQKVIQLRYFQELSYKEISDELGEPMNNIKVKLLRAKKLLAELIRNA